MIQSMTGFGRATCEYGNKKIVVEIKSLNSKQLDVSTRISGLYREKDIEIRNELSQKLERGKIDFLLYVDNSGKESVSQINQTVVEAYYLQITTADTTRYRNIPHWNTIISRMDSGLCHARKSYQAMNLKLHFLKGWRMLLTEC